MRTHALVVESRKEIIEELEDRLLSINHTCEIATSQIQARQCLQIHGREYSYVILSLDVPARPDRPPKIKFGFNLFKEILESHSSSPIPIVITLNCRNINSEAAISMVNDGAFIAVKPFEDDIELSLEVAVSKALKSSIYPAESIEPEPTIAINQFEEDIAVENLKSYLIESELAEQDAAPVKPEMTFFKNRVELCGVAVCGDSGTLTRRLLDLLKERTSEGKYRAYSGYELAVITDCESGPQGISATISKFREKAFSMLEENDVTGLGDIIVNDRSHGYRLEDNIQVINNSIIPSHIDPQEYPSDLNDEQKKILEYLNINKKASRLELQDKIGISEYAVNRHLQCLREKGLVKCQGKSKATLWLPVK